jgi:adenylyltransferase/sulfurtransferase
MSDSGKASESIRGPSCSTTATISSVQASSSISCTEYSEVRRNGEAHVLLDVRVQEQFDLCSLEGSINLPLEKLEEKLSFVEELSEGTKPVYCLCRRGIASASATTILNAAMENFPNLHSVKNIEGGLDSWRKKVDKTFPKY